MEKGAKGRSPKKKQDYTKIRHSAYTYVVVQGYTQRQTAEMLGVSEQSLSDWAREGDWRNLRKARQSAESTTTENLKKIIAIISEQRLALEWKIADAEKADDIELEKKLRKEANSLSDDLSKQNKTLKDNNKENGITLGVYIDVMDSIFNALRNYDEDIFDKTIDFQSSHIRKKTQELG